MFKFFFNRWAKEELDYGLLKHHSDTFSMAQPGLLLIVLRNQSRISSRWLVEYRPDFDISLHFQRDNQ